MEGKSGSSITGQMRPGRVGRLGECSMDEPRSKVVTDVFVRLFEQGLIYRGKRLVAVGSVLAPRCPVSKWCWKRKTAHVAHPLPLADGSGHLTVANTGRRRCWAIAVAVDPTR
jgi:valyl-tRNA synthetase